MVIYGDEGVVMGVGTGRLPRVAVYKDVQLNSFSLVDFV